MVARISVLVLQRFHAYTTNMARCRIRSSHHDDDGFLILSVELIEDHIFVLLLYFAAVLIA